MAPKPLWQIFWKCHKAWFQSQGCAEYKTVNTGGLSASNVWKSYTENNRSDIKNLYVRNADISGEPPRQANNWGAGAAAGGAGNQQQGGPANAGAQNAPQNQSAVGGGAAVDEEAEPVESREEVQPQGPADLEGTPAGTGQPDHSKRKTPEAHADQAAKRQRPHDPIFRTDFPNDPGSERFPLEVPDYGLALDDIFNKGRKDLAFLSEAARQDFLKQFASEVPSGTLGDTWRCDALLGSGTFGAAYRWNLVDADNNIQDTIIMKEISISEDWKDVTCWSTDQRDVHREVAVHRIVSPSTGNDKDGQQYFITFRGFRVSKIRRTMRIAMNEARAQDLNQLAKSFDAHNTKKKFRQKAVDPNIKDFNDPAYEWMPTCFIWELFAALVSGVRHMHTLGIVHRDLKPANIFLDVVDDDQNLKGWKLRPLIADYGTCMPIDPVRYENPDDFDRAATPGYQAPEQWNGWYPPVIERDDDKDRSFPIAGKADVYALAVTMWEIMHAGHFPNKDHDAVWIYQQVKKQPPDDDVKHIENHLHKWDSRKDSKYAYQHWKEEAPELEDIIARCLRWHPNDRLDIDALEKEVMQHLSEARDEAAQPDASLFKHLVDASLWSSMGLEE